MDGHIATDQTKSTSRSLVTPLDRNPMEIYFERYAAPEDQDCVITLLRPFSVFTRNTLGIYINPPIGIAYIAATLERAGYKPQVLDAVGLGHEKKTISDDGNYLLHGLNTAEIIEAIDPRTKILGFSIMYSQGWVFIREMIQKVAEARPDVTLVVGGEHATALPDFVLEDCPAIDFTIAGEGEISFLRLVHGLTTGEDVTSMPGLAWRDGEGAVHFNGPGQRLNDIDSLPRPAWHLFDMTPYFETILPRPDVEREHRMPILTTRGCPYQCTFCSNPIMWSPRYIMRDPVKVVDEIEDLVKEYDANTIHICDLTATVNKDWIFTFCSEVTGRGLKLTWDMPSGTRSEALDENILAAMYESGCNNLSYAPESGSKRTLKRIKKRVNLGNMTKSAKAAMKQGYLVKMHFIIGFPGENRLDFLKTMFFSWRMAVVGVQDAFFNVFSPYPGSELFTDLLEDGTIEALDDKYFRSLAAYLDPSFTHSYCKGVSSRELGIYRIFGFMAFYGIVYLTHPSRVWRLLKGILTNSFLSQNIFEARLKEIIALRKEVKPQDSLKSESVSR